MSIDAILTNGTLHSSTKKSISGIEYGVDAKSIPIDLQYDAISASWELVNENLLTNRLAIGFSR
jgi:hypothetical protein